MYNLEQLNEAKRQIESTIHKLKATVITLENKENKERLKSQITLAKRRIEAFELALTLINQQIENTN